MGQGNHNCIDVFRWVPYERSGWWINIMLSITHFMWHSCDHTKKNNNTNNYFVFFIQSCSCWRELVKHSSTQSWVWYGIRFCSVTVSSDPSQHSTTFIYVPAALLQRWNNSTLCRAGVLACPQWFHTVSIPYTPEEWDRERERERERDRARVRVGEREREREWEWESERESGR